MWEFILARYNYWIVICLMMVGLYIVFSRGNLVKTLIGLNLFQTSVFIFYITIGKISGGTAPILMGDGAGGDHHSDEADHATPSLTTDAAPTAEQMGSARYDAGHVNELSSLSHEGEIAQATDHNDIGLHGGDVAKDASNDLFGPDTVHIEGDTDHIMSAHGDGLHQLPELTKGADGLINDAVHGADKAAETILHSSDVIYSNPLPHVLILTAIVVGVATTAVGLALAVRIREAYGTIEEDELEEEDYTAEYGHKMKTGDRA